jgi:hypothetical protein
LEVIKPDGVEAKQQTHGTSLLEPAVEAIIVHQKYSVNIQHRAVIGLDPEVIDSNLIYR